MGINGLLVDVRWEWTGTQVTADLLTGTTVLPVLDPEAITEGENVWIAGTGPYEILDADVDAATFTITPGLTLDIDSETEVATDIGGQPGRVWVCEVVLADSDRPIEVPLTIHDLAVMPEGTYDPPATIVLSDDLERVENLPGNVPVIDGAYIPPETLPPPEGGGTDGEPPPSSPKPEVIPGIGTFYLRWAPPPNEDPMRFEIHVSPDLGFTESTETMYSETSAYSVTVRHQVVIDPETGEPKRFAYDTPYYFRIVAKDDDGAAAAGLETSGVMTQITGPDIAATTITGENIVGGTLTGDLFSGTVVLGSTISTGALDPATGEIVGARIEMGPSGLRIVDVDGNDVVSFPLTATESAKVRAHMEILSAEVLDNFTLHGLNNSIAASSDLLLQEGVVAPTVPPGIAYEYDEIQLDTSTAVRTHNPSFGDLGVFALNPNQIRSIHWNPSGNYWSVTQQLAAGFRRWRFNSSGAIVMIDATHAWCDDFEGKSNGFQCFKTGTGAEDSLITQHGSQWQAWGKTPGGVSTINNIPDSWVFRDDRPPALAYDSALDQYMLIQNDIVAPLQVHVRRFHLVAGTGNNAVSDSAFGMENNSGLQRRIAGAVYGSGLGLGTNKYAWIQGGILPVYVADSSGVLQNDDGSYQMWATPTPMMGFTHNGSQFVSVDATGKLTFYENWNWSQSSDSAWVGTSLFDSDTAGVSTGASAPHPGQSAGQHETPVGGLTQFIQRRRARLVLTVGETPDTGLSDDPDKWRIYYSRQTAKPTAAQLKLAGTLGSPTARENLVMAADPTGAAPPGGIAGEVSAANNFPAGSPAQIKSIREDALGPLIMLRGNGAGRVGPFLWGSNGMLTSPMLFQSGTVNTGAFSAANTDKTVTITFPYAFPVVPILTVSAVAASSQNIRFEPTVNTVSTTGATIVVSRAVGTGAMDINWIAMRPTV